MDQLLAMIIVPPLVGVITYAVLHHLLWKKDEKIDASTGEATPTRRKIAVAQIGLRMQGAVKCPAAGGLYLCERKERNAVTSAFPPLLKREPT